MQIKQQMLAQQVQKKIAPLYVLIGQDTYLLDDSLRILKNAIKKQHDYEEKILNIQAAEDWNAVLEEANAYSLFSDTTLLNIYYDKKTLDAAGKKVLTEYLRSVNPRCFIIIRAPNVPAKQIQWLSADEQTIVSVAYPLNPAAMKSWIATQFSQHGLQYVQQVPDIIHHYTQGNMLACAQVIEKIALTVEPQCKVTIQQAQEHLSNQCDHDLFELIDVCLSAQKDKVIQILRHASNNKTEPTLVLWMLTQEVRTITQCANLINQRIDLRSASAQLKIWPQRISLYQNCCSRLDRQVLQQLHRYCYTIDERIKSNLNTQVWNSLENLALSICTGQLIGDACTV